MEGYIKLHRQILKWEWYDDANTFRVFLHCLLSANHEDGKWHGIAIKRGQFISSTRKMAYRLHLSVKQIRTCFLRLEKTHEMAHETTNRFTLFTVVNYDKYQINDPPKGTPEDEQRANKGHTKGTQRATNNNDKNNKNEEEEYMCAQFDKFWSAYPKRRSKASALKAFRKVTVPLEILLSALEQHKKTEDWTKENGKYIPLPATWLNGKRWEDEITTPQPPIGSMEYYQKFINN